MALLHAAKSWSDKVKRRIVVFTVDHGLRSEAAGEARRVAEICESLSVDHETLHWRDPHATQNAARSARYRLIGVAMRSAGARCLLTGHTHDDVVETMLIRRRHGVRDAMAVGPTIAAPLPVWPEGHGMTVLRPMLDSRRSDLRDYLVSLGSNWVEDPSNEDRKFERVRVRQFLARHPQLSGVALRALQKLRPERTRLDRALADQLSLVKVTSDGLIDTGSATLSTRLLTLLVRVASGSDRDPRASAIGDMMETLQAPGQRQTIGGAWVQRTHSGILIGVDPAAATETMRAGVFDGRYLADESACLPMEGEMSFLLRHARPKGDAWRSIIPDRIAHIQNCLQASIPSIE